MKTPVLDPCPACKGEAHVTPAVKRGLWIAECANQLDCDVWPTTEPYPSEVEASDAWNRQEFAADTKAAMANAE